jgi:nitrile hydratase
VTTIDHDHDNHFTPIEARVKALETLMVEKGYVDPAALDAIVETYETKSARATAPASSPKPGPIPAFAARLKADGTSAVAELGYGGRGGEHIVACFNTPRRAQPDRLHLCSCYPWPVLGCRRSGTNPRPIAPRR